jgi:hypothetical protein
MEAQGKSSRPRSFQRRKGAPVEHGPWEDYAKERTVQIPGSAIYWLRPDKKRSEWDAYTVSFPREMTAEEIVRAFQSNMLLPRPTFSLRSAENSDNGHQSRARRKRNETSGSSAAVPPAADDGFIF